MVQRHTVSGSGVSTFEDFQVVTHNYSINR